MAVLTTSRQCGVCGGDGTSCQSLPFPAWIIVMIIIVVALFALGCVSLFFERSPIRRQLASWRSERYARQLDNQVYQRGTAYTMGELPESQRPKAPKPAPTGSGKKDEISLPVLKRDVYSFENSQRPAQILTASDPKY